MASKASLQDSSESDNTLRDLMARIAGGDQEAFAGFYDRTAAQVYGLIRRILRNPAVAEEVTLDVYAQVWKRAFQYDAARSAPMTWLIMLARCRAIDSLRSRRNETQDCPLDCAFPVIDGSPNAEEVLATNGRAKVVRSALEGLGSEQREAIELSFFAGLSHTAIAEKLGQPVGTVKSRIRAGMQRLRAQLQEYGDPL